MMTIREYKRAESLEEAWQLNQKKPNRILGGMIWLKMETINVGTAIDLSGLGLDTIEETEDSFSIGAMVTLRQISTYPRKGTETFEEMLVLATIVDFNLSPQGDGNRLLMSILSTNMKFQLIPARGRKRTD